MKWLKRTGLALFFLPVLLIGTFILYEIFGMGVNHFATWRQTERLRADLEEKIPGVEIVSVYSETGNTSGTGNHVDCLSVITFSAEMEEEEIENRLSSDYGFDEWACFVERTEEGNYLIYLNTRAPFEDNIEGH